MKGPQDHIKKFEKYQPLISREVRIRTPCTYIISVSGSKPSSEQTSSLSNCDSQ